MNRNRRIEFHRNAGEDDTIAISHEVAGETFYKVISLTFTRVDEGDAGLDVSKGKLGSFSAVNCALHYHCKTNLALEMN